MDIAYSVLNTTSYFSYQVGQDVNKTDNSKCWQTETPCSLDCCWENAVGILTSLLWSLAISINSHAPSFKKLNPKETCAHESTIVYQRRSLPRQTELPARKGLPRAKGAAPSGGRPALGAGHSNGLLTAKIVLRVRPWAHWKRGVWSSQGVRARNCSLHVP